MQVVLDLRRGSQVLGGGLSPHFHGVLVKDQGAHAARTTNRDRPYRLTAVE